MTTPYFKQLDGLRCFAVLFVMIDHWLGELSFFPLGYFGVNTFFVLSGFLITQILLVSKQKSETKGISHWKSLKNFVVRRSLRIFPAYFLLVAVLIVLNVPEVRTRWIWYVGHATNWFIVLNQTWLGNSDHFWSLAVEEQFYLVFPWLVFFVPQKWILPLFTFLISGAVALRVGVMLTGGNWLIAFVATPACLDALVGGSLLAYLYVLKPRVFANIPTKIKIPVLGIFVLLSVTTIWLSQRGVTRPDWVFDVAQRLVFSATAFWLIASAIVGFKGWVKILLENTTVQYLGKISYGLYLYHNFVFNYYHTPAGHPVRILLTKLEALGFGNSILLHMVIFFILTVAVATVSWYVVEKPVNQLKKHFNY